MTPRRIQLQSDSDWMSLDGAVSIAHPSRFGNPFKVRHEVIDHRVTITRVVSADVYETIAVFAPAALVEAHAASVAMYEFWLRRPEQAALLAAVRSELHGMDLACWCPLETADGYPYPCHGDALLRLAVGEQITLEIAA